LTGCTHFIRFIKPVNLLKTLGYSYLLPFGPSLPDTGHLLPEIMKKMFLYFSDTTVPDTKKETDLSSVSA
jgi:hypothetical protein